MKHLVPCLAAVLFLAACGPPTVVVQQAPADGVQNGGAAPAGPCIEGEEIQLTGKVRPPWINDPSAMDSPEKIAFVGVGQPATTEQTARSSAIKDARKQFVESIGVDIEVATQDESVYEGKAGDMVDPNLLEKTTTEVMGKGSVAARAKNWHVEKYKICQAEGKWKMGYKAYVLTLIEREKKEEVAAAVIQKVAPKVPKETIQKNLKKTENSSILDKAKKAVKDKAGKELDKAKPKVEKAIKNVLDGAM